MGCLSIIVGLIVIVLFATYPVYASIVTVVLIILGLIAYYNDKDKQEEQLRLQNESKERARRAYNDIKTKIKIPDDALKVQYKNGHAKLMDSKNYIWVENDNLCFFPAVPPTNDAPSDIEKILLYKISLDKIEYYATRGEIIQENKITGGGGGGSTIGGAIVGGVIAGGVGAVIGSRKKTDSIKSELVMHDNRETFLNFFDDQNVRRSEFFDFKDYSTFNELLPEKAFEIVNAIRTNSILNKANNGNRTTNITDQIRELAKLKEEGILTDEEFTEKKRSLLEKIR